jgi:D-cysteine desulfhydrase
MITKYMLSVLAVLSCVASESTRVKCLEQYAKGRVAAEEIEDLMKHVVVPETAVSTLHRGAEPLLFQHHPSLADSISYMELADLPTPIQRCITFGKRIGISQLFLKDDGKTGICVDGESYFGGNKVRKLEFILADALAYDAAAVITIGGTGSNHVLATAACAKAVGLKAYGVLLDQPRSPIVKRNLLLQVSYGTHLLYALTGVDAYQQIARLYQTCKQATGKYPYLIPVGGSMPLGVLGYINAAFELKHQVEAGILPEPKVIFVAAGSAGTSAGLLIGLRAAGLSSRLVAVHCEPETKPNEMRDMIASLANQTWNFLQGKDQSWDLIDQNDQPWEVLTEFGGTGYGEPLEEALSLAEQFKNDEQICLDPTYTSKAIAGMCSYVKKYGLENEPVLFWNTFCGDEFTEVIEHVDYRKLPEEFWKYVE